MELHQGRDVRGHGFGTAPMVEWRACEDTGIRIGQRVKVGGAREPSCVHGNVYGGKVREGPWGSGKGRRVRTYATVGRLRLVPIVPPERM